MIDVNAQWIHHTGTKSPLHYSLFTNDHDDVDTPIMGWLGLKEIPAVVNCELSGC